MQFGLGESKSLSRQSPDGVSGDADVPARVIR